MKIFETCCIQDFDLEKQVIRTVGECLKIPTAELKRDTTFRELCRWDSLTALSLLVKLEEDFQAEINSTDLFESQKIADIIQVVSQSMDKKAIE